MKYVSSIVFLLFLAAGWNNWSVKFNCAGGREGYEELKWDLQNEERGFPQNIKPLSV